MAATGVPVVGQGHGNAAKQRDQPSLSPGSGVPQFGGLASGREPQGMAGRPVSDGVGAAPLMKCPVPAGEVEVGAWVQGAPA